MAPGTHDLVTFAWKHLTARGDSKAKDIAAITIQAHFPVFAGALVGPAKSTLSAAFALFRPRSTGFARHVICMHGASFHVKCDVIYCPVDQMSSCRVTLWLHRLTMTSSSCIAFSECQKSEKVSAFQSKFEEFRGQLNSPTSRYSHQTLA